MALTNFGIVPGGAAGAELQAVTRRAAMPAVVVQLGKATPTLSAMLAAAEPVRGGVSPITIPVQGSRMVTAQWVDYSGSASAPTVQPGLLNAEYNLAAFTAWIPYYMFEGLVQQDAEIVPIVWARMNDAGNVASDNIATLLFNAISTNTALQPFSLFDVMATTDPAQGALGNIAVASNTWWEANVTTIATITGGPTTLGRVNCMAALQYAQKGSGGEPPSCMLLSPGAWMALAADVIGAETYMTTPEGAYGEVGEGPTVGFPALRLGTVPVYSDIYLTDGTVALMPNFNYLAFKIHADAAFTVVGPESLLPQYQLAYVMVLLALLQTVCSKRNAQSKVTTWTGAYII